MNCWRCFFVLIGVCVSLVTNAAEFDLQKLSGVPDPQARVEQLESASLNAFNQALREYDEQIERVPYDIMAHLARCKFIETFAGNAEYATYSDEMYERSEACRDDVAEAFPGHPEVQLQDLEQLPLDRRFKSAEETLARVGYQNWSGGQVARLNVLLAIAAEKTNGKASIEYARRALTYDERADVRELLGRRLLAIGDKSGAIEALTSAADPHDDTDWWYQAKKLQLLAQADAPLEVVLPIYEKIRDQQGFDHLQAARALMRVRANVEARHEFAALANAGVSYPAVQWDNFRFEFDNGTPQQALAAYNRWRDSGWSSDPLGVNRIALMSRDVALPWQARDLSGIGGLLLAIVATGAFMLLPISLVHYRGLARRARAMDPYPRSGWQLRHAWLALVLFGVAQIFAFYGAGPFNLENFPLPSAGADVDSRQLAQIAIVSGLLGIIFLLPLGAMARRIWSQWSVRYWSVGKALLIGGLVGAVCRIPLLFVMLRAGGVTGTGTTQQEMWMLLEATRDELGIFSALWLVGLFAPVIEEFIFRGVLLNALASHIRFHWANLIQAALFSVMHLDLNAAISLFIFGLLSAGLAKRSGGLLASMAMHSVFNLIGVTLVLTLK